MLQIATVNGREMINMEERTFDDEYGRHALVLRPGDDGPAFGRVDVTQLGLVGNPVFMPEDYVPRHAK